MDYVAKQKMLWRSRRSILELDLFFERFIQSGKFNALSENELGLYNELLQMDDEDILQLFQGKVSLIDEDMQRIVDQIRT